MDDQGRSLELGPGKDGANGKLARPPKGPVGAGDHEDAGTQVHVVVSFLPQPLGSSELRRTEAQMPALQGGVRRGRC